jgi:uncharacterized protein YjbJ (UPF0337 family)
MHRVALKTIYLHSEVLEMNKDQVKGKAKEVGGKIQQKVGEAVGSSEQQLKGMKNQAEGNIQQKAGDVKEAAKDIVKDRGNR